MMCAVCKRHDDDVAAALDKAGRETEKMIAEGWEIPMTDTPQAQGAAPLIGKPAEWASWLEMIVECSEEAPPDGNRYLWPEDSEGLLEVAKHLRTIDNLQAQLASQAVTDAEVLRAASRVKYVRENYAETAELLQILADEAEQDAAIEADIEAALAAQRGEGA